MCYSGEAHKFTAIMLGDISAKSALSPTSNQWQDSSLVNQQNKQIKNCHKWTNKPNNQPQKKVLTQNQRTALCTYFSLLWKRSFQGFKLSIIGYPSDLFSEISKMRCLNIFLCWSIGVTIRSIWILFITSYFIPEKWFTILTMNNVQLSKYLNI